MGRRKDERKALEKMREKCSGKMIERTTGIETSKYRGRGEIKRDSVSSGERKWGEFC